MQAADPAVVPQARVQPRIDLILALQHVAEELFAAAKPLRVTVRVATTENPHYPVLGEVLEGDAFSLSGGMSQLGYQGEDIHRQATVTLMRETGKTIVQRDTAVDPPVVPHAREFGGQAGQMLIPLRHAGAFVGFIAVHSSGEVRDWSSEDIAALERARDRAEEQLARAPWFEVPWPFRTT
ncbi:MAG TPA: GAF domain-containing protein [Baekduia sp.]|nr:GAF domain-containing protein [Baekduia sp.]